jgi:putative redox protein
MEKLLEQGVSISLGKQNYATQIQARTHKLVADEPLKAGGTDTGFAPYELLLAGLGSCTAITMRMYADRKEWDLQHIDVKLNMEQETTTTGKHTVFSREIKLTGNLDDKQKERLLSIAKQCPVAKILNGQIEINSRLV